MLGKFDKRINRNFDNQAQQIINNNNIMHYVRLTNDGIDTVIDSNVTIDKIIKRLIPYMLKDKCVSPITIYGITVFITKRVSFLDYNMQEIDMHKVRGYEIVMIEGLMNKVITRQLMVLDNAIVCDVQFTNIITENPAKVHNSIMLPIANDGGLISGFFEEQDIGVKVIKQNNVYVKIVTSYLPMAHWNIVFSIGIGSFCFPIYTWPYFVSGIVKNKYKKLYREVMKSIVSARKVHPFTSWTKQWLCNMIGTKLFNKFFAPLACLNGACAYVSNLALCANDRIYFEDDKCADDIQRIVLRMLTAEYLENNDNRKNTFDESTNVIVKIPGTELQKQFNKKTLEYKLVKNGSEVVVSKKYMACEIVQIVLNTKYKPINLVYTKFLDDSMLKCVRNIRTLIEQYTHRYIKACDILSQNS